MLTRGELIDLLQRTSWSDDAGRTKQAAVILEEYEVATKDEAAAARAGLDGLVADYMKATAERDEAVKLLAEAAAASKPAKK